jgi:TPR repeat protein
LYGSGQGVKQDLAEAARWYRRAAQQGHVPAQYSLGLMYYNGQGVRQDNVQAHLWFSLAAEGGEMEAVSQRDVVTKLMSPEDIAKAEQLASKWRAARPAP